MRLCSVVFLSAYHTGGHLFPANLQGVHFRGWLSYAFAVTLVFIAIFMMLTRFISQGKSAHEVKVLAPPPMNTMEQLLAIQNAISQAEGIVQDGNIVLLKLRALLLSLFPQVLLSLSLLVPSTLSLDNHYMCSVTSICLPHLLVDCSYLLVFPCNDQASEKFAAALLVMALTLAFLPSKYVVLLIFLETFTRYSPMRKTSTERWMRRLREWWFSIPAAPVILEREKEDKKKK